MKYVTVNEPFFQGHFPGYPVMPGVLVLEALIQLSTLLAVSSGQPAPGTMPHHRRRVRFKRQVIPGDQLMLETQMAGRDGKFTVRASVDGELATEAEVVLRRRRAAALTHAHERAHPSDGDRRRFRASSRDDVAIGPYSIIGADVRHRRRHASSVRMS